VVSRGCPLPLKRITEEQTDVFPEHQIAYLPSVELDQELSFDGSC